MSATILEILDGGNKCELLAQLGDIGRIRERPTFRLELRHPEIRDWIRIIVHVQINGVSAEDGSGDSWMIEGHVSNISSHHSWVRQQFEKNNGAFQGLFNTKRRTGLIYPGVKKTKA